MSDIKKHLDRQVKTAPAQQYTDGLKGYLTRDINSAVCPISMKISELERSQVNELAARHGVAKTVVYRAAVRKFLDDFY